MTNKKLKMAAMSVALTACVAASPLAAKADAPEAAPEKKEPVAEETKKEENTVEPQVNQEAKNAQKTLKDAEVKYNKDNPTTNPDGFQKLDGVIVTNPEGGETNPNPNPEGGKTDPDPNPEGGETNPNPNPEGGETNPNPDSGETDPNPNPGSGETGSGETGGTTDPEQKKPEKVEIGTAEKTEKSETTVETKPNPGAEPIVDTTTPPTVEKNPDGSTTITQPTVTPGTETTTTTGTGTAEGDLDTVVTETPKEKIDLEKELGENPDISWDIKKGADAVNDYKVEDVTTTPDGNQQTLKLKKEKVTTAEMTAEDIAKLVDAEKPTVNPDGTYTLTRTETIPDAEGNPQTRTTYITIQDNKVTTKTTTELTITRKKEKQEGQADIPTDVVLPEVELSNGESLPYTKLDEMLQEKGGKDASGVKDGTYTYTETAEDGTVREYTIKIDTTSTDQLTNAEIVAKLNNDRYSVEGGDIYYRADNGERVKLTVDQNTALRRNLSIDVSVTETKKGTTEAPNEVTTKNEVKDEAVRNALKNAVEKLDVEDPVKAKLTSAIANATLDPNGGTFKEEIDGKIYILTYTGAEVKVETKEATNPDVSGKDPENITDVKDNTVKGTAYVTSGTISWTAEGQKGEYTATVGDASVLTPPEGATPEYKDGRLTGYKLTSTDNDGNTVTTTYTITYGNTSSMSPDELNRLAEQNLMEKTGCKTLEELAAAGYTNIRFENASTVTWTVTQTTQKKTTNTETLNNKTLTFEGDKNWTIAEDGNTLTYDGQTYTKDEKGNFTRTDENDKNVTYTATEQEEDVLSPEDAKAMLAKEFEVETSAIELNGTTATFMKNGAPVTVDCANLKKRTLKIERSVDASWQKVATNDAELAAAYEELWAEIEKKKGELGKGETLYVGDLQITEKTEKTQVIEYIEKYVTQADMSPEQLKAALKAQAEAAQKQMVTVNADSDKYKEELPNYYAGERTYYTTKDGQRVENKEIYWDWDGYYYLQWNGWYLERVDVQKVEVKPTYIEHLDLASGAQLKKQDGTSMDCVLVNPTLVWNYDADKLVENDGNIDVGLEKRISLDREGGKGNGHYEYDRGDNNNNPDKSAFYKVTGTVLYDAVKDGTGEVTFFGFEENLFNTKDKDRARNEAFNAYLNETKQTAYYNGLSESKKKAFRENVEQTYIVEIGPSANNKKSPKGYQVYTQSAEMTAYGYMTRDANTCINRTYKRQDGTWEYVGGYDLMISKLVQTKEGKVVGETESKVKNIFAPLSIRKSTDYTHRSMKLTQMTTVTTQQTEEKRTDLGGSQETVKYLYDKSESVTPITEETKVEGHGTDHYKSFTNLIRNIFKGEDTGTVEGGSIKYVYHSEKNKDGTPVKFEADKMVVTTKQDAEVHYTFTSQESRDVWIKGYTQTVVPPVNPGPDSPELPPVEDAKPAPAPAPAPEAPVLPVVQDARPDPAPAPAPAPETPVLPAVQDAKLIQTGTSGWLADLMLGAGMVLSAAGYWMERKRKAMFYKSQH